jgi:N-acetylglucosaminyldiphosphoundecaprenol N-acetyl-beta-D-mannosaminyltransferase
MANRISIFNLSLNLSEKQEVLAAITNTNAQNLLSIGTVNPEFILTAQKNKRFAEALQAMTLCTVDGFGFKVWLTIWQLLKSGGGHIRRYPGADLVSDLFEKYSDGSKRFFLIGGPDELLSEALEGIKKHYPNLIVAGTANPGIIDPEHIIIPSQILENMTESKPDIVLVGLGAPKQELWMQQLQTQLPVPVVIGVGGTFKFYTAQKRAPKLVRNLQLEWLYRALTETNHWKRAWNAVVTFSFFALGWIILNLKKATS